MFDTFVTSHFISLYPNIFPALSIEMTAMITHNERFCYSKIYLGLQLDSGCCAYVDSSSAWIWKSNITSVPTNIPLPSAIFIAMSAHRTVQIESVAVETRSVSVQASRHRLGWLADLKIPHRCRSDESCHTGRKTPATVDEGRSFEI